MRDGTASQSLKLVVHRLNDFRESPFNIERTMPDCGQILEALQNPFSPSNVGALWILQSLQKIIYVYRDLDWRDKAKCDHTFFQAKEFRII